MNVPEINNLSELSSELVLNLTLDNTEVLPFLEGGLNFQVGVFIEIDTGGQRSGISWKDVSSIENILEHMGRILC